MPYSRSLGLIFVAITKTGTTSVTRALTDLALQHGEELQMVREPQDFTFPRSHRLHWSGWKKPGRPKHLSALQLSYVLDQQEFDRCFKFSIVRNPWARSVSDYLSNHVSYNPHKEESRPKKGPRKHVHNLEFEPWVENLYKRYRSNWKPWLQPLPKNQLSMLIDKRGRLLVDYVGRLEKLQDSLDHVSRQVGCEVVAVQHLNGSRAGQGRYTDYYNENTRGMITEMYRSDIEYFDYSFGE